MKLQAIALILTLYGTIGAGALPVVVYPDDAGPQMLLAAKEIARYVYLRTGTLPEVATKTLADVDAIALRVDRAYAGEAFAIKTFTQNGRRIWAISGGSEVGVLYGAYRFVEKLGVRFYLHGDVIPDGQLATWPEVNEEGRPLFATRGIQPFHDFPEGPDWWSRDDYLAYVAQLAKLRMNFLGLHCYPEGHPDAEPLVWIGSPADLDRKGRVQFSYPARWADTRRVNTWGYAPLKTSAFCGGANQLFSGDDYGPDVQDAPFDINGASQEVWAAVFERTAGQMQAVCAQARALGVRTCVGTETPLTIPKLVQERLKLQGKDPKDPAVVRELYEGIFRRIARRYPVDYYWLWTPENWTWEGDKPGELAATIADINAARDALNKIGQPFTLATCGWVLGPQSDRAALDGILPKACPMSCINRQVGHTPDEPGFANISDRPKWVIPWMENDPDLVAPQPWVGRLRTDAVDGRLLGCTGLLGIHWRSKAIAGNIAALAAAAWDQSWTPANYKLPATEPEDSHVIGAVGGTSAHFTAPVIGADVPAVYQNVRYDVTAYRLEVPNGIYTVMLKFNEPHYTAAGKRVFGVKLQGQQVLEHLDLFAKVGQNKALDYPFNGVVVTNGQLHIEFTREIEYPCIAGIVVGNAIFQRRINCGGGSIAGYEADTAPDHPANPRRDRTMPVADFYTDFARVNFGASVAEAAGRLLAKIDGTQLPEPCTWIEGPGGIKIEKKPWAEVKAQYTFVDELAGLRAGVQGAGNSERFDYWLNTYRYMATLAELGCARGELDALITELKKAGETTTQQALAHDALAMRIKMARLWEQLLTHQLAATDTPGELGTLANLEQHNRLHQNFLTAHDQELAGFLDAPWPAELTLSQAYAGPARLIVPTVRTLAGKDEALMLKIIALDHQPMRHVQLCWRPLGRGAFRVVPVQPVAHAIFRVALPKTQVDIEYYIQAETAAGATLRWPVTAPHLNQTVVVWQPAR